MMEKIFHFSKIVLLGVFSILIPLLLISNKVEKNYLGNENCDLKAQIYNLKSENERMLNEIKTIGLSRQTIIDSLENATIIEQEKVTAGKGFGLSMLTIKVTTSRYENEIKIGDETKEEKFELTAEENKKLYAFIITNGFKRLK